MNITDCLSNIFFSEIVTPNSKRSQNTIFTIILMVYAESS